MAEYFPAVEMDNGNVATVGLEPFLVARRGNVDRFELEGNLRANALDDVQRGVTQGAVRFGKECNAIHGRGSISALMVLPAATASSASLICDRVYRSSRKVDHRAAADGRRSISTAR